ncbi:MAG: TetR/AcrR family transcriptional regulator [Frankiaceae bacterium]|nr:TetR/AcrR family transcriptional regulator [Frankiaceae bacterium]MBV9872652.1 TetR/AcrR family transcriptional regulator [Frankiaceae bacterium]
MTTDAHPAISLSEATDGRLARSARTRLAIVDAMRALNHAGDLRPTAARVAERAGVSLRTVWQHFDDFESLLLEAGQRDFEIVMRHVTPIDPSLPLEDRIDALIEQRARTFADLAPVWRAARLQEPFSVEIRRSRDRLVRAARDQLQRVFATELARLPDVDHVRTLDALTLVTNWSAWEATRTELGLSPEQAAATIRVLLRELLAA